MTRTLTYAKALNEALTQEMERDPAVHVIGEDISFGGVYTVTKGLLDRFGPERVRDTPIAEAGFTGMATGAAILGMRPIVELMFVEFTLVAADQFLNQAAKIAFLSGDEIEVPVTFRTQQGIVGGGGPQHSQSLESIFLHVPGLAVALPSCAADAKGLLAYAIRADYPTLVIEHKALYFTKGEVPDGDHLVPFGKAAIRREGTDVTLIAWSRAVSLAMEAALHLQGAYGISAEVVDVRTLAPLDEETLRGSIQKTGAAVVVQEAPGTASMAAHIASTMTQQAWKELKAPILQVCGLDMPIPYAQNLERQWLPSVEDIVAAVNTVCSGGRNARTLHAKRLA